MAQPYPNQPWVFLNYGFMFGSNISIQNSAIHFNTSEDTLFIFYILVLTNNLLDSLHFYIFWQIYNLTRFIIIRFIILFL